MKFSYNWLKELVRFKDTAEELAEFLTLRAFEVESTVRVGGDYALDVKILPNRVADASGHIGLAREIASLKDAKLEAPYLKLVESKTKSINGALAVKIDSPSDCSRYIARVVRGVKTGKSPEWLKNRLEVSGLQSINNLVDAANFIMLETGQPLHVFDYEKLGGKKIIVRRARKVEKIVALDEKTYALTPEILVIADAQKPAAIAGIKGGKNSGVTAATKTVVLEAACFDPARIRTGSRLLNLKTDASYRFEHGLDPNAAETAVDRLASLITKLAGGEILAGKTDVYPKKLPPKHVALRVEYGNRLIGVQFAPLMYEVALKRLGFSYQKRSVGVYHVEVPTYRRDIEIEEDIIEEVIRVWGYDKVRSQKPLTPLTPPRQNDELFWEDRIKEYLVGAGFYETLRYVFTGETELGIFGLKDENLLEMANPLAPEYKFLSASPCISFIRSAKENEAHEDTIRIFGITKSFQKGTGAWVKGVDEKKKIVVVLSQKSSDTDLFFRLKGVIDGLLEGLGLAEHWYDDAISLATRKRELQFLHPYRVAEIKIGDKKIGFLGEVHPAVRDALKARHAIVVAEMDAAVLYSAAESEAEFNPIARFPAIIHDVAVIVPEEEKTENVTNIIENIGGKTLVDVDLFDYFQDEAMRKGRKKSLAFHLIFQSPERTLKDEEVARVAARIVKALEEKGWTVRK